MKRQIACVLLGLAVLWTAGDARGQCEPGGDFTVCPGADRIYINTDRKLGALRLSDGGILWQIDLPLREDSYLAGAATLNTVIVWAGFPSTGIYAFDAKAGNLLWHIETSSYGVLSAGPYFVFSDAEHWEALTAVEERTGKRVWHHSGSRPTRGGVDFLDWSDRAIITEFFAIDAHSGQILMRWSRAWYVSGAALSEKFVVISNRNAGPKTRSFVLYSLPDYRLVWMKKEPLGPNIAGLLIDSDRIFVATYSRDGQSLQPGQVQLDSLVASSGETIWTKTIRSSGPLVSSVQLSHGVAVFATEETANSRMVQGFDATTGQLKWTVRTDHRINGVTCAGARCYLEGEVGEVLAVDAQTGAQRWYRIPAQ